MAEARTIPALVVTSELAALADTLPIGMFIVDEEGSLLLANDAAERIWGIREPTGVEEFTAFTGWSIDTGERIDPGDWPAAKALKGEVTASQVVDIERFDGSRATILISSAPIRDDVGRIVGSITFDQDVTERREEQRLLLALAEIESVVTSTLRIEEVLDEVLGIALRAIGADSAALYARRAGDWVVQAAHGHLRELIGQRLTDTEVEHSGRVVRTQRVVAVPDVSKEERLDQERAEYYGIGALIDATIVVDEVLVGDVAFYYDRPRRAFSDVGRRFVSEVGFALSRAVAVAAEFQSEEEIANALQRALLELPAGVKGIDFTSDYTSASDIAYVGGDFYDLLPLPEGNVCIVLGDVSGKALQAARFTMIVKNALRAYAHEGHEPAEAMRHTNDLLVALTEENIFVTVFLAVLDTASGHLTYCSAGHPPSFIRRDDGTLTTLATDSPLVGGVAGLEFVQSEATLGRGDYLFMYTDGAIEARNAGEMFGEERLADIVRKSHSGEDACRNVSQAVTEFSGGRLKDDLAILAVSLGP